MKSYTDIEQSEVLEKILPPESADMYWDSKDFSLVNTPRIHVEPNCGANAWVLANGGVIAWSLDALLNIINTNYYTTLYHDGVAWNIDIIHHDNVKEKYNMYADYPVNACYELILKLHELNLL